jgi:Ca2+-transporting ATPase
MLVTVVASVALHLVIVYVPALQTVFGTEALSLHALALAAVLSSFVFFGVEIEKWAARKGWLYDLRTADAHVG